MRQFLINMENKITSFKLNRILSNCIDALVIFVLFWACFIFPFLNFIGDLVAGIFNTSYLIGMIITGTAGISLGVLYLFISPILLKNSTCGLKINGLKFENVDKSPISKSKLLLRSFFSVISIIFTAGLAIFAEILTICISESGREFFDYFTGIRVVSIYES